MRRMNPALFTPPPNKPPPPAMSRRRPTHESPKQQRHRPQQSTETQQPNLGMSPEARYAHNLKVLRRRDPSIIKIFDQFSHVCVYHHNGITWEKNGYEGSMFLYESDSYPPYGFYILNRMGMDDYIQRLYPEDVSGPHGTYLMLRSYPAFATRRVSAVLASHDEPPHKFADAWACPDLDNPDLDKGEGHTVGLWMFPTDAREPMIDVMVRLHSYVKQNVSYPDQFQYGPNRPPPPNPHLRTTSPSPPPHESHVNPTSNAPSAPTAGESDSAFPTGSATELDQLFARMRRTSSSAVTPTTPALRATTVPPASAGARPTSTTRPSSTMTVASLFAALGGGGGGADPHANEAVPKSPTSPTRSGSGIALLDSIFASASAASTPASTPASAPRTTPRTTNIHSPTPSTSTAISSRAPPQVLNHDVITSLLGLPRAGSAASAGSGYSNSSASGRHTTSSREGDNEYEEEEGDGETPEDPESEGSTVLDEEEEEEGRNGAAGRESGSGRPLLGLGGPTPRAGTRSLPVVNGTGAQVNGHGSGSGGGNNSKNGKASGDVTPRALVQGNGIAHGQKRAASVPVPPPMSQSSSTGTVRPHAAAPQPHPQSLPQSPAAGRTPFAASAELWPTADDDDDADGDGEIVELDFADTRALSDPEALREVLQRRRGKQASVPVARHEENAAAALNGGAHASANGAASRGEGEKVGERRGKGKKKGKRERAAERAAEAEVQRGLEAARLGGMLLDSAAGRGRAGLGDVDGEASPSSSRDASASPDPERAHRGVFGEVQVQQVQQVQARPAIVNGHGHGPSSSPAVRAPPPAATALDATQARAAMLSALTRPRPGAGEARGRLPMEKNAFMREVLTLIHTDKGFVDALWQDYVARVD